MYPSDISDKEWKMIEQYFEPKKTGRPRKHSIRTIINAIRYVMRTGCQWRQLPKNFPPWKTVYSCNSRLKKSGIWQEIHDFLVKKLRKIIGKNETPSVGIIDSQSVKTTQKGDPKDYEHSPLTSKNNIFFNMITIMLHKLAHS